MTENNEKQGILIINKESGYTSHDVVNCVRKLYNTKKVGHTGTLDPMARGVLVVLIGRAAKAAEYLLCDNKKYTAQMRLGIVTDTEDTSGTVLEQHSVDVGENEVKTVAKSFVGNIKQVPPMYSALKVGGRKLCDIARGGGTVEREERAITVFSCDCNKLSNDEYSLSVECSKGTYIRTLCADIGKKLGCGAAMSSLIRNRSGNFSLDEAYTLKDLEAMTIDERYGILKPTESLFEALPKLTLDGFFLKLFKSGCEIYQKKIKTEFQDGQLLRVFDENGFYALAQVGMYDDGSAVKSVKVFGVV